MNEEKTSHEHSCEMERKLIHVLDSDEEINKCDIVFEIERLKQMRKDSTTDHLNCDSIVTDLLFATIAGKPNYCDDKLLDSFFSYFTTFNLTVKCVLLPHTINKFVSRRNMREIWRKYEDVLVRMYSKSLLTTDTIETEALRSLKEDMSDETLRRLAAVLRSLVDCSRSKGTHDEMMEIVDWLAWFCSESNEF